MPIPEEEKTGLVDGAPTTRTRRCSPCAAGSFCSGLVVAAFLTAGLCTAARPDAVGDRAVHADKVYADKVFALKQRSMGLEFMLKDAQRAATRSAAIMQAEIMRLAKALSNASDSQGAEYQVNIRGPRVARVPTRDPHPTSPVRPGTR